MSVYISPGAHPPLSNQDLLIPDPEACEKWSTLALWSSRTYFLPLHTRRAPGGSSSHPALVSFLALLRTHPRTHMRTLVLASTQSPEDILASVACRNTRMHVKDSFSPLFLKTGGGLKAKLKTHGTFHLKRQPGWREGQGLERVGVF